MHGIAIALMCIASARAVEFMRERGTCFHTPALEFQLP